MMDEDDMALSDYEDYPSEDEEDLDLAMQASTTASDNDSDGDALAASDAAIDDSAFNDDDLNFSQEYGKSSRKTWEVEYKCLEFKTIIKAQMKEVDQVASMFVIKVSAFSDDIESSRLAHTESFLA
jgi:hypothetical protein